MKHLEYYYVPPRDIKDDVVEFKGSELKHLTVVSRKKSGDKIFVVDGEGHTYSVELINVTSKSAIGKIQKRSRYLREPNFKLTLAQAIPKGNRFDLIIEKGTEIGVSKFIPLITERSIVQGSETKLNRWQKIAIAAMKQCTRSILPEITPAQTLDQLFMAKKIYHLQIIAHPENNAKSLTEVIIRNKEKFKKISNIKSGIILIGAEGGFSTAEVTTAKSWKFETFSLGQRRLRSETAGIIASALTMELIDNWY